MKGIYGYYDLKKNYWVYVGKDSNIEYDMRDSHHKTPKMKNRQKINQVIQKNPDRYIYFRLLEFKTDVSDTTLRKAEKIFVEALQTCKYDYPDKSCFNFEDICLEGQESYWKGKKHSEKSKLKMSEAHKGKSTWNKGIPMSDKTKEKISGENNGKWKNYARIIKNGWTGNKQIYSIRKNGKNIKSSISIDKLVKWFLKEYPLEIIRIPKKEE